MQCKEPCERGRELALVEWTVTVGRSEVRRKRKRKRANNQRRKEDGRSDLTHSLANARWV